MSTKAEKGKSYEHVLHSTISATIITAILYFITARLSLLLAVGNTNVTSVWPPSGIALAAILLWGYRMGPAVLIGAFIANILVLQGSGIAPTYYIGASFTTAAGNMLEGIIGAYFIRRFSSIDKPFGTMKDLFVFILFGSMIGTMISATIGVGTYCFITGGWLLATQLWFTWWLGDAAGVLIVSPVIILARALKPGFIIKTRLMEAIAVFTILTASSVIILWNNYHLEYVMIPPLLWISFRFGRLYSATAVLLVSGIAVAGTIFGGGQISQKALFYLQTYVGVISIVTLCLSVITHERGEVEKARLAFQKQLYDIIEFLPDATFAIDRNGIVISWNRAMEQLSGVSRENMIGKGNYEYSIPFFNEPRSMLIDYVMKTTDPDQSETFENMERNGTTLFAERYNLKVGRYLASSASALVDEKGNIYGAIGSIRDITDRKAAEKELEHYKKHLEELIEERSTQLVIVNEQLILRIEEQERVKRDLLESERKYRDLVESANSVILRWKPDGTVTFFNVYAQNFFGFTEAEITGKNILGTIVPIVESSGRDLSLLIEDIVRNPEAHTFNENENITKDGKKVWIAWTNKAIFDGSGSLIEVLSVGNDITERKNMEGSLRKTLVELAHAKERAESADRLKSAFLATMSHELRTPLNSIIGFTGIILQGLAGPLNGEQEKQMNMVRDSAQHLLSLINDVLDISKIEADQLTVYSEPFNLRTVIEKTVAALKPMAEKKGISLVANIGNEIGETVNDRRRVEQILLNLLNNAVKFTERGSVSLFADIVSEGPKHIPAAYIKIVDTGIGIQPDQIKELFQPFHQIDTGLTRKSEGTGLGLAICRRLANLMGCQITVESEWGNGSIFSFIIPAKEEEHAKENTSY